MANSRLRVMGILAGVLPGATCMGGCGPEQEFSVLRQSIENADGVTDNFPRAVAFETRDSSGSNDFEFLGSGSLFRSDGGTLGVLTAGHVGAHTASKTVTGRAKLYSYTCDPVFDPTNCVPDIDPTVVRCVLDPTFIGPRCLYLWDGGYPPSPDDCREYKGAILSDVGRDLAYCPVMGEYNDSIPDLEVTPDLDDLMAPAGMSLFAYGPSGRLGTYSSQVTGFVDARLSAVNRRTVGELLAIPYNGTQKSTHGDSGGPWLVERADGSRPQTAVHVAGKESLSGSFALRLTEDLERWLTYLSRSSGAYGLGDLNEGGRADQIIAYWDTATSTLQVMIVFGEGGVDIESGFMELQRGAQTAPPAGLRPHRLGMFNPQGRRDDLLLVAEAEKRVFVLYNLNSGDAGPALIELTGTNRHYDTVEVTNLNGDSFQDIRAHVSQDDGGGTELYHGNPDGPGLIGPSSPEVGQSCTHTQSKRMVNVCGSRPPGSSCSCDAFCVGSGDCCGDFEDTCISGTGEMVASAVINALGVLLDTGAFSWAEPVSNQAPVVTVVSGALESLGVLLDRNWVLTASSALEEGATAGDISVTQDGAALGVTSVVERDRLALLRVDAADVELPPSYRAQTYSGALDEIGDELFVAAFGDQTGQAGLTSARLTSSSWIVDPGSDLRPPSILAVARADESSSIDLPVGSPVTTQTGQLAGIVAEREVVTVPIRLGPGLEPINVDLTLYDIEPMNAAPNTVSDLWPSAPQWTGRNVTRAQMLDEGNGDGTEDLWGVSRAGTYPALVYWPLGADLRASAVPVEVATLERSGAWELAGRGSMPLGGTFVVWRETDTGEIVLWRMLGTTVAAEVTWFTDPEWDIRAIGDVNGDWVDDIIWESQLYQLHYLWHINDVVLGGELLEADPDTFIGYGVWFGGLQESLEESPISIVAAGHFPRLVELEERPETNAERGAVDLIWQNEATGDLLLSDMSSQYRFCDELEDPDMLAQCEQDGLVITYEMHGNLFGVGSQSTDWKLGGTADYNHDGIPDLLWHMSDPDGPRPLLGHVQIWMSSTSDGYVPVEAQALDGTPLVLNPDLFELSIH